MKIDFSNAAPDFNGYNVTSFAGGGSMGGK